MITKCRTGRTDVGPGRTMFVAEGTVTRSITIVEDGLKILDPLLEIACTPEEARFDTRIMLGEALSNVYEHEQLAREVNLFLTCRPGTIQIAVEYDATWFCTDTDFSDPALLYEHGRGLPLMRGLSEDGGGTCEFRFVVKPGQEKVDLTWRAHRLTVAMNKYY